MKQFALIQYDRVVEIIPEFATLEGQSEPVPLEARYHPDFIARLQPYEPDESPA